MCGICGIVDFSQQFTDPDRVLRMTRTLQHRGPDTSGIQTWPSASLGHTRLSILDLSSAGRQPMHSDEAGMAITYNGELYNFRELRRQLDREGVRFGSSSDTEVALQAIAEWGLAAVERFNGMFALGLWDARRQQLALVRDRFGIKPLYYYPLENGLVFGSEIKALLASGLVPRELDWAVLHEYLYYGAATGPATFFRGIRELPPGHCLTLSRDGCELKAYWTVDDVTPVADSPETATANVRTLLEQAVADHLVSDVPVGVFLSGGVDSSCIAALAARQHGRHLKTYSVGFDFAGGVNELPKAKSVADRLGTEHHELHVRGGAVRQVLEELLRHHDQPFADAANIPLYLMCRELKGQIKVILQGDGGDELFAGYRRYKALNQLRRWRLAATLFKPLDWTAGPFPGLQRVSRFLAALGQRDAALRMALLLTEEDLRRPPTQVIAADALPHLLAHDPFHRYRALCARLAHLDETQRMLFTDCAILLPKTFLEKVDRATMAHGIEVRVPLLDANLAGYVMSLPSSLKARGNQTKWILRRAARGLVPDEILDGKKTGFGVPYKYWLRTSLAEDLRAVLLDPATLRFGLLDARSVAACIEEHVAGRRDRGFLLYKLFNLALWLNAYLGPAPAESGWHEARSLAA